MKHGKDKLLLAVSWVIFIVYLVVIIYYLFFNEKYGRTDGSDVYRYNLQLFKEISRFLKHRKELGFESVIVNIIGNVLAFAPFGFCLPIISNKDNKFFKVALWCFLFSLCAETIQLIYKVGIFDVDDLFLNTIGGIFGFILFRIFSFCYRRTKRLH